MNSHFQSSDTTCTSSGGVAEASGLNGSSLYEPIQITPPRKMMVRIGIDQTTASIRPE